MGRINGLRLWYASEEFLRDVLEAVKRFPARDPADLRGQLARGADSINGNLAEGTGRGTRRARLYSLRIARGEIEEAQGRLRNCVNQKLLDRKTFYRLWNRSSVMSRMVRALIARLEREEEVEEEDAQQGRSKGQR